MERTFIMIKPDAVKRKLIGEIITRIERRNLDIIALKMLTPSRELAEAHYAVHKNKDFYASLVDFIMSGNIVAMVVKGDNAIKLMRNMMGALNPNDAISGTIRGDYTCNTCENLIHGSDAPETAKTELSLWFPELS